MRLKTLLLLLSISHSCYLIGQSSTFHQSFPLKSGMTSIIADFDYPYQIKPWSGNTILIETSIQLDNASQVILDYFIESGRYTVVTQEYPATVVFKMKEMIRKSIETRKGACEENILLRLFVPKHVEVSTTGKSQMVN